MAQHLFRKEAIKKIRWNNEIIIPRDNLNLSKRWLAAAERVDCLLEVLELYAVRQNSVAPS